MFCFMLATRLPGVAYVHPWHPVAMWAVCCLCVPMASGSDVGNMCCMCAWVPVTSCSSVSKARGILSGVV
jgi:hypothetical protein